MTKLSVPIKRAVLKHHSQGLSASEMAKMIASEYDVLVSRQAIIRFIFNYQKTRRLVRKPGSGRPTKITDAVLHAVEAKMQADDETTAAQLASLLSQCGIVLSFATIKRSRQLLGWTFHGTRYCQLI